MIFDKDGNELGDITLSDRSTAILHDDGARLVVLFHTPRMLEGEHHSGSFTLRRVGTRLVTDDIAAFKAYFLMQQPIAELRHRILGAI